MLRYLIRIGQAGNEGYADFPAESSLFDAYLPVAEAPVPVLVYFHGCYVFIDPENGTSDFIQLILKLIKQTPPGIPEVLLFVRYYRRWPLTHWSKVS